MHVKENTFAVMQGEPHLGSQIELELIAAEFEVEDFILEKAMEDGIVHSEYSIGDYTIQAEDYVDVEMANDYLGNTEEADETELYTSAFVEAPKYRNKDK